MFTCKNAALHTVEELKGNTTSPPHVSNNTNSCLGKAHHVSCHVLALITHSNRHSWFTACVFIIID